MRHGPVEGPSERREDDGGVETTHTVCRPLAGLSSPGRIPNRVSAGTTFGSEPMRRTDDHRREPHRGEHDTDSYPRPIFAT